MDDLSRLLDTKVVAILRGVPDKYLEKFCQALLQGGLCAIEVALEHRTKEGYAASLAQIASIKNLLGKDALVGAGTVLSENEVDDALKAGATYIISPNTNLRVIAHTRACQAISMPGALTPSEIVAGFEAGAQIIKLFPAGDMGIKYFKSVKAPLAHIPIMAVGGITCENAASYMAAGACGLGVSSTLVNLKNMQEDRFDLIRDTAAAFYKAVNL